MLLEEDQIRIAGEGEGDRGGVLPEGRAIEREGSREHQERERDRRGDRADAQGAQQEDEPRPHRDEAEDREHVEPSIAGERIGRGGERG